jgi:lipoprotein-anchoring transpeptidase ErfK/SrfK
LLGSVWLALACQAGAAQTVVPPCELLISVPDQKMAVLRDGQLVARYPVSTSRFGTGDNFGSYKTPLGEMRISDKIGGDLTPGAVIHHHAPTGEVLPVNAPGRDPIVTRVIELDGLEPQNKNAHSRGIYIHGTPEERTIGLPVSWGCIRMRSQDVIKVFNEVPVGTVVAIIPDKLPHMRRYEPPKEQPPAASPAEPLPPAASAAVPSPAPAKSPAPETAQQMSAALPPPISEAPVRATWAGARSLRTSILLANLPSMEAEKQEEHRTAKTPAAAGAGTKE